MSYVLIIICEFSLLQVHFLKNSGEMINPTSKIEIGCVSEFILATWSCLFLYFSVQIKCHLGVIFATHFGA